MCELKDVIAVGKKWFIKSTPLDSKNHYWRLFHALMDLTSELLESGKPEECYFDYEELAKRIQLDFEGVTVASVDRKALAKHQKEVSEALKEHEEGLVHIARELGLKVIPQIEVIPGGGKHKKTVILIKPKIFNVDEREGLLVSIPNNREGVIQYYLEARPELPWWARWCSSIEFGSGFFKRFVWIIFVTSPFFAIFLVSLHLLLIYQGVSIPKPWLSFCFIVLPAYVLTYFILFKHLIGVINNNISLIPDWMLPLRLNSAVLEIELKKPDEKGYRIKSLTTKIYMADCPVCGHKVYLKSGKLRYWGRIIGVCDANPIEHKFSFDYMTKSGSHLL